MDLSTQGVIYIGFSTFYVFVIYHGLKALFEIRDHLLKKPIEQKLPKKQPVKKKR